MRTSTFRDHKTFNIDFLEDRFDCMRLFVTESENNARKYYCHKEFVVIDETLRNFYTSRNCNFVVYMKDKPGNYGPLFRILVDVTDCYGSRVIPYVTPLINNPKKGKYT